MKKLVLTLALAVATVSLSAQTVEELKAEKAKKTAAAAKLTGEANALQAKIDAFPGWKFGVFGTVGANLAGFNDWFTNSVANGSTGNVGITANGYANLDREKFFWRNSASLSLGWVKLDDDADVDGDSNFNATTDIFNLTSLYGYKLNKKWAASVLAEYRTGVLEGNFNDPGYLDLGIGFTWTPISELVVVIHPLNYNFVFSEGDSDFESSLGAKIVADYNKQFGKFKFRSNLSGFYSYEDGDLSNGTWTNSLGFNVWKGIGVGLESGLRLNKQESFDNLEAGSLITDLSGVDTDVQSYWLVGLSYAF